MQMIEGFPFFSLTFDQDGVLESRDEFDAMVERAKKAPRATDAIFLAHGFRNDVNDASKLYSTFLRNFRAHLSRTEFKDIAVYAVEVSHLLTSLTSHPDPPRGNGIPPEARTLPGGTIGTLTTDAQGQVCCSPALGDWSPIFKEIFTAVKAIFISNPQEVFTKFTGGREYSYMNQKGLERAITDIGDEIHSQYLLTYRPNNPDEAGYHEIEVKVLKPGLKVTTRPGYWSAARPQ